MIKSKEAECLKRKLVKGLIAAVPVPRYSTGQLHRQAHIAYSAYLTSQQIAGIAVWAHTGRGLKLTREERKEIITLWKNAMKPGQSLIAGVGASYDHTGTKEGVDAWRRDSITMAYDAIDGGADALLVFPPSIVYLLPEEEQERFVIEYHAELTRLQRPLILFYLYEAAGGVSYSAKVIRELLRMPDVIGIKIATLDSVMTMQDISKLLKEEFPDILHISGEDRMLGYALMRGADCALLGMGAAFPNIQADLIAAYHAGNYGEFIQLSERVDALAECTFVRPMDKYILRMLWCLVLSGVIPEEAAHDLSEYAMTTTEIEQIRRVMLDAKLY